MRVVIQKVLEASVKVDQKEIARIGSGLLILLGIEEQDDQKDVEYLVKKIVPMRIFLDADGKMNLSVNEVQGACLVVSQFTLHANTKKGNRPSFIRAAKPQIAEPLYTYFIEQLSDAIGERVQSGQFGADMKVALINDGPVTITMDSKAKE